MKNKKNIITLLVVFVLTVVALYLFRNYQTGTIKKELMDFAVKDTASVIKIFMADKKGNKVTLARENGSNWIVNGKYTARKDAIKTLLTTISSIQVDAPVSKAAYNTVIKEMATTGTKVEIYTKEDVKIYYVGGTTQDFLGTYMMLENSSAPFVMHIPGFQGYLTTRYFINEPEWRGRTVFQYRPDQIKSVKVEYPQKPELSFQINVLGPNTFSLKSLQQNQELPNFDTLAVKSYLLNYKEINLEAFVSAMKKETRDSILTTSPMHIITVTDNKGKTNSIKTYPVKAQEGETDPQGNPKVYDVDRMYGQLNKEKDLVLIQYYVFNKLLQPITRFQKGQPVVKK